MSGNVYSLASDALELPTPLLVSPAVKIPANEKKTTPAINP
jgi:hypothetical protein